MHRPKGAGSSPLTRGKLVRRRRRDGGDRLIPAHAGKTSSHSSVVSSMPAHPRSRGENLLEAWGDAEALGSSPLTRGKLQRGKEPAGAERLIPAHAGKTGEDS